MAPSSPPLALDGLTGLRDLPASTISALLDSAQSFVDVGLDNASHADQLEGSIVANVFLEDSTRTRCSFTIAAHRLGASTVDLTGKGSSASKGESLDDTLANIDAMGVDVIVLRCTEDGAPQRLASRLCAPVVNAGDGKSEHPTQALLDALTLRQCLGDLAGRRIAIVGDVAHSRVAGSNVHSLTKLGMHVHLVGPEALIPDDFSEGLKGVSIGHDLDAALPSIDAIMMLRVQFERGAAIDDDYHARFGLTEPRLAMMPNHAVVLHPGPVNRGVEIVDEVADHPSRSVILRQVTNGVACRMAVLSAVCGRTA